MRITCPNCDAQYEVEDSQIPETGRDVQCSNCGHGWYQYPVGLVTPDEDEDDAVAVPHRPATETVRGSDPAAASAASPRTAPPVAEDDPAAPPGAAAPRPPLDESLRAILREEAEREAAARAADAQRRGRAPAPVEVQGDLGLPPQPPPVSAQPRSAPAVEAPLAAATAVSAKRDRLPDVEAINSTLTAGAAPPPVEPPKSGRGGGFVQGFAAVFLVAALLYALYLFAPRIGAAVPVIAGPLDAYVSAVDAVHRTLVSMLRAGG